MIRNKENSFEDKWIWKLINRWNKKWMKKRYKYNKELSIILKELRKWIELKWIEIYEMLFYILYFVFCILYFVYINE